MNLSYKEVSTFDYKSKRERVLYELSYRNQANHIEVITKVTNKGFSVDIEKEIALNDIKYTLINIKKYSLKYTCELISDKNIDI